MLFLMSHGKLKYTGRKDTVPAEAAQDNAHTRDLDLGIFGLVPLSGHFLRISLSVLLLRRLC
jgi:hypothetical protein